MDAGIRRAGVLSDGWGDAGAQARFPVLPGLCKEVRDREKGGRESTRLFFFLTFSIPRDD